MTSNLVDYIFGSQLDFLLATNRISKRVAAPKRRTRTRAVSPKSRGRAGMSHFGHPGDTRKLRAQMT